MQKLAKLIFIAILALASTGCDFRSGKFVLEGVVVEVGPCGEDFGGSFVCSAKVKSLNSIRVWDVNGGVMTGQKVYKHCWDEESSPLCYAIANRYIRKRYKNAKVVN